MSGPADSLEKRWGLIAQGLNIDKPQDIHNQSYLGCQQERWEVDLPGGGKATVDCKNMNKFMKSCVQLYLDLAPGTTLHKVATPFLQEDQKHSPARARAGTGPVEECPWCRHTFSPNPYSSISELDKHRKALVSSGGASSTGNQESALGGCGASSSAPAQMGGWRPLLPRS